MEKGDKGSTMIRMGVSGWMFLLVPAYPGCPGSKAVKRSSLLLLYWCHVLEQMLFCSYFCSWNFVIVIPLFIECGNFFRFLLYWKAVLVSSSIHTLFLLQSLWWHRHTQLFIGPSVNQDLSVLWCCWLGVRKSIRPRKNWVMRCWCGYLSGARCRLFAYGPADATASQKPIISCLI